MKSNLSSPNLITLIGFSFNCAALALILYYSPDLQSPLPGWVCFLAAMAMWLYSTFDNVDGKQARRTGTSSPLGELFDHGCDALNCAVGGLVLVGVMGLGRTENAVILLAVSKLQPSRKLNLCSQYQKSDSDQLQTLI